MLAGSRVRATWPEEERELLATIAQQVAIAVQKARAWEDLQQKEDLRGRLLEQLIHAQEDERARVARELHDEASQSLTALIMRLGAARQSLPRLSQKQGALLADMEGLASSLSASPSGARFRKEYTRAELGDFVDRQGDWIFDTEGALCQADDGDCTG